MLKDVLKWVEKTLPSTRSKRPLLAGKGLRLQATFEVEAREFEVEAPTPVNRTLTEVPKCSLFSPPSNGASCFPEKVK